MAHEVHDALALLVREAQPREDGIGDLGADALVLVERVVVGLVAECARPRLADVVEERGDAEDRFRRRRRGAHGVCPRRRTRATCSARSRRLEQLRAR